MKTVRHLAMWFCLFVWLMVLLLPSAFSQANVEGQWSTLPYTMPINPIHAALLKNGQVLIIAGSGNYPPVTNYQAAVWNPQSGSITTQSIGWDMFCNGMVILKDGRPFIDGGTIQYNPFYGSANASVFDPLTDEFANLTPMANGRWYPTVTELPDGTILALSGDTWTGGTNKTEEIFSPSTWSWSTPYQTGWTPPLYPRLHVLPNGNVFYSAPGYQSQYYYPATHTWSGVIATTNYANARTYGSSVLLPLLPANNYKPVVMIFGGNNPATATTELIDLSQPTPAWVWGPSMSEARIEMNAVILPSGNILAIGGSGKDEVAWTASYNADLYKPVTNTFSSAGKNAYARLYHSTALLLPDATVWLAGSNPERGTYEPHMEIYQPAYLFNSNGTLATRPTITSAPSFLNYGQSFLIQTPNAANISSVVLIRAASVTHSFDMDQRLVGLTYTVQSGALSAAAPPNSNIAPPGYYLLFLLNSAGVPSVASFVQLTAGPDFSLTPAPWQQITVPGENPSYTVKAYPSGKFNSTVNLSVSGLPAGVSASFTVNPVAAGNSSAISLNTAGLQPSAFPETYTMTVTGTSGTLTRSAPLSLLVNSPGSFSASASPSALTVAPGASGQVVVTITPSGGFVGVTSFSVTGLPTHVNGKFTPSTVKGAGSTTLTLTAGASAAAGSSNITITAASGTLVQSTTVALTIQ